MPAFVELIRRRKSGRTGTHNSNLLFRADFGRFCLHIPVMPKSAGYHR